MDTYESQLNSANSKIRRLQADNDALTQMLNEASDKLAQLTKPLFNVGDVVTVWVIWSATPPDAVYGEGDGHFSPEVVAEVRFYWGNYYYDMKSPLHNIAQHLIQKVG